MSEKARKIPGLANGYTKSDVAAHYGVTVRTVENWMARGWLVASKRVGRSPRFTLQDIRAYERRTA